MTVLSADVAQWFQTWLLFIAYTSDNLGYLSDDGDNALEPHTVSLYFPIFGETNLQLMPKHYVELKSSVKDLYFVSIVNITACGLTDIDQEFQMIWHYPMGTIQVTFKVNRNKQPIITDHQTFANNNNNHNNNLNHEIYFNAIGTEDKILYLTFHTTLIEEKVGEHKFTLINRKTKQSFESMIINVIAKKTQEANKQMETTANTSHDLHKYKTVCNGNIHFCSVIYMAGSNIICERDDTSVLSKITNAFVLVYSDSTSINKHLLWFLSSLFALACIFLLSLIGYYVVTLQRKIHTRTNFKMSRTLIW